MVHAEERTSAPRVGWAGLLDAARADLFGPNGPTRHPWPYCNGLDCCDEPGIDPDDWLYPLAVAEWAARPWQSFADIAKTSAHSRALALAAMAIQQQRTDEGAAEALAAEALTIASNDYNYHYRSFDTEEPGLPWVSLLNAFSRPAARRLIDLWWRRPGYAFCGAQQDTAVVMARATVDLEPEALSDRIKALAVAAPQCVGTEADLILRLEPSHGGAPAAYGWRFPPRDLNAMALLSDHEGGHSVRSITFSSRAQARDVVEAVLAGTTSGLDTRPENLMSVVAALGDPQRALLLAQSNLVPEPAPALLEIFFRAHPGVWPEGWVLPEPTSHDLSQSLVLFSE